MDAYRFGGNRICDNKQVRTSVLEEAVWDDVSDLLCDPERIQKEYERRLDTDTNVSSMAMKQNDENINKVKRSIARLIDAYEDELITKDEFEPRVRQGKERLGRLQEEQSKLVTRASEQQELRAVVGHIGEFKHQLSDGINDLNWNDKREVIRALVKRVEIDKENVRVVYKIGQLPFVQGPASGAGLQDCLWGDLTDAFQCVPALRAGSLVRARGETSSATPCLPRPLRGRFCGGIPRPARRPPCPGSVAETFWQIRTDDPSRQDAACCFPSTVSDGHWE